MKKMKKTKKISIFKIILLINITETSNFHYRNQTEKRID